MKIRLITSFCRDEFNLDKKFSRTMWILLAVIYLWYIWVKVFKNGPSKICGRQPLKKLKWNLQIFLRLPFTNFTWSILEYFDPNDVTFLNHFTPLASFFTPESIRNPEVYRKSPVLWNGLKSLDRGIANLGLI